jgi:hypothetical protein
MVKLAKIAEAGERRRLMSMRLKKSVGTCLVGLLVLGVGSSLSTPTGAQSPELQQRLADLKASAAKNKQELGQFTWVEQDTISLKGEQKKQEHFQVRLGPDGKPQKTSLDPAPAAQDDSGRRGRLTRLKNSW